MIIMYYSGLTPKTLNKILALFPGEKRHARSVRDEAVFWLQFWPLHATLALDGAD
jgi:hypothetical protein